MNAIDYFFDKIYILNLTKCVDRRLRTTQRLQKLGIENYEFFRAYDGRLFPQIWGQMEDHRFNSSNYLACTLSHLAIYQDALDRGFSKILILEDDCFFNKNIDLVWSSHMTDLLPADLWYFGYIPVRADGIHWDYGMINKWLTMNVFEAQNLWGLFAYGIRRNLMEEVLKSYQESFTMELDRYFVLNIQPTGRARGLAPQLWACENVYSENSGVVEDVFHRSSCFTPADHFI